MRIGQFLCAVGMPPEQPGQETVAPHPDPGVDPCRRHLVTGTDQCPVPGRDVVVDRIHQCAVEVEDDRPGASDVLGRHQTQDATRSLLVELAEACRDPPFDATLCTSLRQPHPGRVEIQWATMGRAHSGVRPRITCGWGR